MVYVAVLLDRSHSMFSEGIGGMSKYMAGVRGIEEFLGNIGVSGVNVYVGLFLFPPSNLIDVLNGFYLPGFVPATKIHELRGYRAGSGTPIGRALINVVNMCSGYRPLVVKLISDGEWNEPGNLNDRVAELNQLEGIVGGGGVRIDLINIAGVPDADLIEFIVGHGGRVYSPVSVNDVASALADL